MNWTSTLASVGLTDDALVFEPDTTQPPGRHLLAICPEDEREQLAGSMADMLARYQQVAASFGLHKYDVAGAVAAFIAGNCMAYRDTDFPDRSFMALVVQMRRMMSANPDFQLSSPEDKQRLYEEMAIVGMDMAMRRDALRRAPNAKARAALQRQARTHLEGFLKLDASRVRITEQGLTLQ